MEMEGLYYTVSGMATPLVGRHERNELQRHGIFDSPPERVESHIGTLKELFQMFQEEYGRCVAHVWQEVDDDAQEVGWVFEKKESYQDSPKEHYIQETWVQLLRKCEHCNGGFNPTPIVKKSFNPGP